MIEQHFRKIMEELGLDLNDDSLKDTPRRVAKLYTKELFTGLDKNNAPNITVFENKFKYDQMIIQDNIEINSICEHHFLPFFGTAKIAYIPDKKIVGLSKLNRVADYFSRRPQVQERLTQDIANYFMNILETQNVAVMIHCEHSCVKIRGIKHKSKMLTSSLNGQFLTNPSTREEFLYLPK